MNITLTGNLGAGKTSVCNELKKLGFEIISTGSIFRKIAEEKNISVLELNEIAKKDRSIDDMIDNRTIELGKTVDNKIFDSRLAWNFIPDSFKVFLYIDTDEAAARVVAGENRNAEEYNSFEEARDSLYKRAKLEQARFKELYSIDYYNASNYNLVIETTSATPQEIANEIIRNFNLYKENKNKETKLEINVTSLYPTIDLKDMDMNKYEEEVKKEKENKSKCALNKMNVIEKEGFYFLEDHHEEFFAAVKSEKRFVEVNLLSKENNNKLNTNQIKEFENLSSFKYKKYPENDKSGHIVSIDDLKE